MTELLTTFFQDQIRLSYDLTWLNVTGSSTKEASCVLCKRFLIKSTAGKYPCWHGPSQLVITDLRKKLVEVLCKTRGG